MRLDPFIGPAFAAEFRRDPFVLYDVGAAGGLYPLFPDGPDDQWFGYGFEPMPASFRKLSAMYSGAKHVSLHELALTDSAGSATFRVFPNAPTSSSLNANALLATNGAAAVEDITVTCERLDAFCLGLGRLPPDFIKLDTEGTELNVLLGGERVLGEHALGVVSEIKFIRFSETSTTFAGLDQFLQQLGFVFFDIQTSRMSRTVGNRFGGKKGPIDSAYVLYLRDFADYYRTRLTSNRSLARSKLLKMLSLAVRFLYLDYATELIDFGRSQGLLTAEEAAPLIRLYTGTADLSWKIPDFPGKRKLGLLADYVSYLLHPEMKLAAPPMFNNLGNRRSALVRQGAPDEVRIYYPVRSRNESAMLDLKIKADR